MRFFLKVSEKLMIFTLAAAIFCASALAGTVSMAPEKESEMMSMLENQTFTLTDSDSAKAVLEHFLYKSQFAAVDGDIFPYPNKEDYTEVVEDGTYTAHGILAKGCFAYSKFVSHVMYGEFGTKLYHRETAGELTVDNVRRFILKNVQSGEHIRMGTYHSLSFVSGDEKGFYTVDYAGDGDWGKQKIQLSYFTFEEFTQKLNTLSPESDAKGRPLYVFDVQKEKNEKYDYTDGVGVILDGKLLSFDVNPAIINDRTYVPLRTIAEKLSANVSWVAETSTAVIEKEGIKAEFPVNKALYFINGQKFSADSPAIIVNGRTLVPLRFAGNALSLDVEWDGETSCVLLSTPHIM